MMRIIPMTRIGDQYPQQCWYEEAYKNIRGNKMSTQAGLPLAAIESFEINEACKINTLNRNTL